MTMKTKLTLIALLFTLPFFAQQFVNGSFENSGGYFSVMANQPSQFWQVTDTVNFCNPNIHTAQHGTKFIHNQATSNYGELIMELTTNIDSGKTYIVDYYVRSCWDTSGNPIIIYMGGCQDSMGGNTSGVVAHTILSSGTNPWQYVQVQIHPQKTGKYIKIYDDHGMMSYDNFSISNAAGLNEVNKLELKLFPNPSDGSYQISANTNIKSIKVYDITGKTILEKSNLNKKQDYIDISQHQEGIYFVRLTDENGNSSVEKLIKH